MRKLTLLAARVLLNPIFSTVFVLTSLTLLATGYGLYGTTSNLGDFPVVGPVLLLAVEQLTTYVGPAFSYIDPVWYLSNMQMILIASVAVAAVMVVVAFSSPYLPRGEKEMKAQAHLERKHVIRSLFPTVVVVTYPMLLALGLAGTEAGQEFAAQASTMFKTADLLVTYAFFAGFFQLVHWLSPRILKPAFDRHVAFGHLEAIEQNLKAVGIQEKDLAKKLKGMPAKKVDALNKAAIAAVESRQAKETLVAEQGALLRQASEEDRKSQASLRKLLNMDDEAFDQEQPAAEKAPSGPVLIDLEEEANAPSPAEEPQKA